jgi:hypothetical protein
MIKFIKIIKDNCGWIISIGGVFLTISKLLKAQKFKYKKVYKYIFENKKEQDWFEFDKVASNLNLKKNVLIEILNEMEIEGKITEGGQIDGAPRYYLFTKC